MFVYSRRQETHFTPIQIAIVPAPFRKVHFFSIDLYSGSIIDQVSSQVWPISGFSSVSLLDLSVLVPTSHCLKYYGITISLSSTWDAVLLHIHTTNLLIFFWSLLHGHVLSQPFPATLSKISTRVPKILYPPSLPNLFSSQKLLFNSPVWVALLVRVLS